MEQLLDFIFSNFYFVLILIGLFYTMFFRKSPLEKPENRPGSRPANRPNRPGRAGRMPDFGGSPVFPPKPARTREQTPPEIEQPLPVERREPRAEYGEPVPIPEYTLPDEPEPQTGLVQAADLSSRTDRRVQPSAASPAVEKSGGGTFTRDELTRAVVWAEIIGPPRARRPYRR